MSSSFKVACIQNSATKDMDESITAATAQVREAASEGAELICLPEYFTCLDVVGDVLISTPFVEAEHPALAHYRSLAQELERWLLLGSLAVRQAGGMVMNRSYLLQPDGQVCAHYDKIHLFDVQLAGGESYRESATIAPGGSAVVADTPWGGLGLSICYDLRFPQLYHALAQAGAHFLSIPAAFTKTTGEAHWHVLQRARAIETGCYVFAPCQCGVHGEGRASYGHSLIIDPWGRILAEGGEEPTILYAQIDPAAVAEARRRIPALDHARSFDGPLPEALTLRRAGG